MSVFQYIRTSQLNHQSDCELIGIQPDMTLYVREYADDEAIVHVLDGTGQLLQSFSEETFADSSIRALNLTKPTAPHLSAALNYAGPRHRGMREAERVQDIVRPLSIQTKMQVIQHLRLNIMPMALLGIAESYVLAEALIEPEKRCVVCRRIRLAYALPQIQFDAENQPYDYDTIALYSAHLYDYPSAAPALDPEQVLSGLPGVNLQYPMDCLIYNQHLFIAENGHQGRTGAVHTWRIHQV